MQVLPFLTILSVPASIVIGHALGGGWNFLTLAIAFGLIPLLDLVVGINPQNPQEDEEETIENDRRFAYATWLLVPLQVGMTIWGAYIVTQTAMTAIELIGFVVSVGIMGGTVGINVSHELVHRHNRFEPLLGRIMLASVAYTHWAVEHVSGHHRYVATPEDPATSRIGESSYAFLPRSIIGGFVSAWKIETSRLLAKELPEIGLHNRVLRDGLGTLLLIAILTFAFGPWTIYYFIAQSFIAIGLLELVNYVEHYGLSRAKLTGDRYEKVTPAHSWNSGERLTNYLLFNLQRHSDHHAEPRRRYQILRHIEQAPQLPTGYAGMLLLALIPPLWFAVMNPRIPAHMNPARIESQFSTPPSEVA
jgi:alkane 1-monooxygenase